MEGREKTIFQMAKVTIEYENYWLDPEVSAKVREERFFEHMKDAKVFVWNEYRNRQKELGMLAEEFDEDKMEYEYPDKHGEGMTKVKIEYIDVNHFDYDVDNEERFFSVNVKKKGEK